MYNKFKFWIHPTNITNTPPNYIINPINDIKTPGGNPFIKLLLRGFEIRLNYNTQSAFFFLDNTYNYFIISKTSNPINNVNNINIPLTNIYNIKYRNNVINISYLFNHKSIIISYKVDTTYSARILSKLLTKVIKYVRLPVPDVI